MAAKYFLKHKLHFQYDPISGNPEKISPIRLKTENHRFGLGFKPRTKNYKRAIDIQTRKNVGQAESKGTRKGRNCHPSDREGIILKDVYVMHYEDMTDVPTKYLVVMGINILEQYDNKVKSCNEKGKFVE